jgi:hypothetical protein
MKSFENCKNRLYAPAILVVLCPIYLGADVVTDWSSTAQRVMVAAAMRFPPQTRTLAIMHAAIFDAVNSVSRKYEPYKVSVADPAADERAAASAAAHTVLLALVPSQQPAIDTDYVAALAAIPNGPAKYDGIALGQFVASIILADRANDGSSVDGVYTPGVGPGKWIPTPPTFGPAVFAAWGSVTPFAINGSTQFLPGGPPPLTSERYTDDFNQVKSLGRFNSTTRTPDQTNAALFWMENSNYTWNAIAREGVAARHASLTENARLFALLNMASADAIISGFEAKYIYGFWRPLTAIQNADSDGNPATIADPTWEPLAVVPEHPDYPSNHSAFSGAAAEVLTLLLGDEFEFTVSSSTSPNGTPRSFENFEAAAHECGMSRIWLGYHFHTAVVDGLNMGQQIGRFAVTHRLKPVHEEDDR